MLRLSDETRTSSSSSVLKILETVKLCLTGNSGENVQPGLKALDSLASTIVPGEENAFAELIPTLLPLIHKSCNENAMDALSAIWYMSHIRCSDDSTNPLKSTKLGPRVIPNLKAIILECTRLVGSEVQEGTPGMFPAVSQKQVR